MSRMSRSFEEFMGEVSEDRPSCVLMHDFYSCGIELSRCSKCGKYQWKSGQPYNERGYQNGFPVYGPHEKANAEERIARNDNIPALMRVLKEAGFDKIPRETLQKTLESNGRLDLHDRNDDLVWVRIEANRYPYGWWWSNKDVSWEVAETLDLPEVHDFPVIISLYVSGNPHFGARLQRREFRRFSEAFDFISSEMAKIG